MHAISLPFRPLQRWAAVRAATTSRGARVDVERRYGNGGGMRAWCVRDVCMVMVGIRSGCPGEGGRGKMGEERGRGERR